MSDGFPSNFSPEEFRCKCNAKHCNGTFPYPDRIRHLAWSLQRVRDSCGPITINSAYRCVGHNKAVGGAAGSQHPLCTAADIVCSKQSPDQVAFVVKELMETGIIPNGGLGRYDTFTHVDIRATKARWDNRSNK